jgi:hypothetical protein
MTHASLTSNHLSSIGTLVPIHPEMTVTSFCDMPNNGLSYPPRYRRTAGRKTEDVLVEIDELSRIGIEVVYEDAIEHPWLVID